MPYKNKKDGIAASKRYYQSHKEKFRGILRRNRKEKAEWLYNLKSLLKCSKQDGQSEFLERENSCRNCQMYSVVF